MSFIQLIQARNFPTTAHQNILTLKSKNPLIKYNKTPIRKNLTFNPKQNIPKSALKTQKTKKNGSESAKTLSKSPPQ